MRVDAHDAQQLQGELKAAKTKLQEVKQAELAARFALAAAVQRLHDYRQIDIEFWDDLSADPTYQDFIPVRPLFRPDYPESPAPLAIEGAAPSAEPSFAIAEGGGAALDLSGGIVEPCNHVWIQGQCITCGIPKSAALDPCDHVWISNTDNPVDGFKCMICGAPKVLLFNNDEQTARAIEAGKADFKSFNEAPELTQKYFDTVMKHPSPNRPRSFT